jgi:phosphatidylglycerophosphate synthase
MATGQTRQCRRGTRVDDVSVIDRQATALLRPALAVLARGLVRAGVRADALTFAALGVGWAAAFAIAVDARWLGATGIVVSRLLDGLDGAVARQTQPTDRGGFLDISLDFLFYPAVPLAFAVAHPAANALPAAVLLAAFVSTGTSFLAFAVLAAKRGLVSTAYPEKSFYFLGGLTEATETLAFFLAMCAWPEHFAALAYAFAALCAVTIATRLRWGWLAFRPGVEEDGT